MLPSMQVYFSAEWATLLEVSFSNFIGGWAQRPRRCKLPTNGCSAAAAAPTCLVPPAYGTPGPAAATLCEGHGVHGPVLTLPASMYNLAVAVTDGSMHMHPTSCCNWCSHMHGVSCHAAS